MAAMGLHSGVLRDLKASGIGSPLAQVVAPAIGVALVVGGGLVLLCPHSLLSVVLAAWALGTPFLRLSSGASVLGTVSRLGKAALPLGLLWLQTNNVSDWILFAPPWFIWLHRHGWPQSSLWAMHVQFVAIALTVGAFVVFVAAHIFVPIAEEVCVKRERRRQARGAVHSRGTGPSGKLK